jgi:hypothetical protein
MKQGRGGSDYAAWKSHVVAEMERLHADIVRCLATAGKKVGYAFGSLPIASRWGMGQAPARGPNWRLLGWRSVKQPGVLGAGARAFEGLSDRQVTVAILRR